MAYYLYIGEVLFPVTPKKIQYKWGNNNKTITLIDEGEVNLIKTPGLVDIEIDKMLLPNQQYPFANYEDGEFHTASYYSGKLEQWKKQKSVVQFKLSRTTPDGKNLLWDTNYDVTIEDCQFIEDADDLGLDMAVKLTLKEYRYWGAKKLVVKSGNKVAKKNTRKTKKPAKSYTVKDGDTLLNIARKQLGDGFKQKKIYDLNKKTIESAAKKHGRKSSSNGLFLFAGTKLKLPK